MHLRDRLDRPTVGFLGGPCSLVFTRTPCLPCPHLAARASCEDRLGTGPPRARTEVIYADLGAGVGGPHTSLLRLLLRGGERPFLLRRERTVLLSRERDHSYHADREPCHFRERETFVTTITAYMHVCTPAEATLLSGPLSRGVRGAVLALVVRQEDTSL